MMRRRAVVGIVALVAAATAAASVLVATRGTSAGDPAAVASPPDLERSGQEALRLVAFDPERIGYEVRFAPARPDIRAQTDRASATISVFLRRGDLPHVVAHDIAHELGHAYDQARMADSDRNDYLAARRVAGAPWLPSGASDYGVGAGDFAEVFALCHAASPDFRSELAPRPDDACALLPAGAR